MADEPKSVLHVLPYPGGGGETYVSQLARMEGYRTETAFVAPGPRPGPHIVLGAIRAQLSARPVDLLHVHGEVAAGLCLPGLALRPSVLTIHGLHLVRRLEGWRRGLAEANLRLIVRAASRTICVGDSELAEVESLVGTTERLRLVRNGVDPVPSPTQEERATARSRLGVPASGTVGLFLGAFDSHKEPITVARAALEAAASGVSLVLLLGGDGPLHGDLEALAGDGTVLRLVGFQSEIDDVLAAADFFVLPSRREGLSFALLEAMSAGVPPVVSDAPGNLDAVGDAGIIVRQGDVAGFRDAFKRLALHKAERDRLGERARARAAEVFSRDSMIQRTRGIYDEILAARPQ